MSPQEQTTQTLKEIQEAIAQVDVARLGLAHEARQDQQSQQGLEALEEAAFALRQAERVAIKILQKQLIKDMEASTAQLNALAKSIRFRVTKMGKFPKALDKVADLLSDVVALLTELGRWW